MLDKSSDSVVAKAANTRILAGNRHDVPRASLKLIITVGYARVNVGATLREAGKMDPLAWCHMVKVGSRQVKKFTRNDGQTPTTDRILTLRLNDGCRKYHSESSNL